MKLGLVFPEFRVTGQYKITGKIFALPIEGIGPFWAIISERQINMLSLKKKGVSFSWFCVTLGNISANAIQSLAIKETSNKSKRLEIVDQQIYMSFNRMRMRLNKYSR